MSLASLFSITNAVAAVAWLVLMVAPLGRDGPRRFAIGVAVLLGLVYAALIGAFITQGNGGFDSLDSVARLFEHRGLLLAGWVHYLAFDLLVGTWQREQARALGFSRWLLAPLLSLTFMFGPIGWLAFLAVRRLRAAPAAVLG